MKRTIIGGLCIGVICTLGIGGYIERGAVRQAWQQLSAPSLPPASAYRPHDGSTTEPSDQTNSPFEPGYSSSQHYIVETSPTTKTSAGDPLVFQGTLPTEINLDVPFTTQAPKGDWGLPYQEACEETSAIMVDAFYHGRTGVIPADEADTAIKRVVAYEKATLGFYEDTNASQTAQFIRGYFGYKNVVIRPLTGPDDIKKTLALGYPVLLPAAGKLLHNPNYRNGGPAYHMLVIRGYTPTLFITNDAGTHNGQAYTYTYDTLMGAAHDWTGDPQTNQTGSPVMLVVLPNT